MCRRVASRFLDKRLRRFFSDFPFSAAWLSIQVSQHGIPVNPTDFHGQARKQLDVQIEVAAWHSLPLFCL
jgi:hypothetical protein